MTSHRDWLGRVVVLLLLVGCSRPSPPTTPAAPSAPAAAEPRPTVMPAKPSTLTTRAKATPEANKELTKVEADDLKTEEREANPYSETVTLKLSVTPQAKAQVTWGAKQIARLAPGSMDAEISRPRGSGPVDLEIKAEGFMPYHTRLYADRNDRVSVRLYRVEEASGLLGYKRKDDKKTPEQKK